MEPISSALYQIYRDTPFRDEWLTACLEGAWRGLMGDKIADFSRPLAVRDAELIVEVSEASWCAVLTDMRAELLRRVRTASQSEIQKMTFVLKEAS